MTDPNDVELYRAAKELFLEAADLNVRARRAFLKVRCDGQPALLRRTEELFAYHDLAPTPGLESLHTHAIERLLGQDVEFGTFRLHEVIGRGGMGVVYRGTNSNGDEVALKIAAPADPSEDGHARLSREAKALGRLHHPNICRLRETGSVSTPAGALEYFAMDLINGTTLRQWVLDHSPTTPEKLRILIGVCDAVHYAHEHDVIHRDLKPENIVVTPEARPVLLDFGIAKLRVGETTSSFATRTGQFLGTFKYMSPEQARGEAIDLRTDVYSLGVICHEVLVGNLPYSLTSKFQTALLLEVASQKSVPVSQDLPEDLQIILKTALEKDVVNRYPTVAEFKQDLELVLSGQGVRRRNRRRLSILANRWPRRRWQAQAALAVVVAIVLFAGFAGWQDRQRTRTLDQMKQSVTTLIEDAYQAIHLSSKTETGLQLALDRLQEAREVLVGVDPQPYTPYLLRYIDWRSGEACFFLGTMRHDPKWLVDAVGFWRRSDMYWDQDASLESFTDVPDLYARIHYIEPHYPPSGMGVASAELARYRNPIRNWLSAIQYHEFALVKWKETADFWNEPQRTAFLTHDLGGAYIRHGIVANDAAHITRGLDVLARANIDSLWIREPGAHASFLFSVGKGYLGRWEVALNPADLDSAEVFLSRSIAIRTELSGHLLYADTRILLAKVFQERARVSENRELGIEAFEQALRQLKAARGFLEQIPGDFERAEVSIAEAALLVQLVHDKCEQPVLLVTSAEALDRAASYLSQAETMFGRAKYPLQWAHGQLVRGKLHRQRFVTTQNRVELERGRALLEDVELAIDSSEDPHLARLLSEEIKLIKELQQWQDVE